MCDLGLDPELGKIAYRILLEQLIKFKSGLWITKQIMAILNFSNLDDCT